jgi:Arylsulfotransferase (ASST)
MAACLAPARAAASVDVFPVAGSRVASPRTQISLRGAAPAQLRGVTVTGSRSGRHALVLKADADGLGASLLPRRPFRPGDLVTVRAPGLALTGAPSGVMHFRVARFAAVPRIYFPEAGGSQAGIQHLHSDPALRPPGLAIRRRAGAPSAEDLFLAPKGGPGPNGPMIVDGSGRLIWFQGLADGLSAFDFRAQQYLGRPVLTWWQGRVFYPGAGAGEGVILDSAYRPITRVRAGNGYSADLHELELTPVGTALLLAYQPVRWHGAVVIDGIVQEVDIRSGLVEFEWHSLDHVDTTESFAPRLRHMPYDYIHLNSVEREPDGSLLVSGRNTSTVYDVDRHSGRVLWRLGGKRGDFRMGPGTAFVSQHDARRSPDGTLTIFDNGAPPVTKRTARGIVLSLDMAAKTATLVRAMAHGAPPLRSGSQGSLQPLDDGGYLVYWGSHSWLSEYDPTGNLVLDGQLEPDADDSYRAYRLPWSATPAALPLAAASTRGGATTVWASWNGATGVAAWQVLAGDDRRALRPVATAARTGFETAIAVGGTPRYVRVRALGAAGRVLRTSRAVTPRRR